MDTVNKRRVRSGNSDTPVLRLTSVSFLVVSRISTLNSEAHIYFLDSFAMLCAVCGLVLICYTIVHFPLAIYMPCQYSFLVFTVKVHLMTGTSSSVFLVFFFFFKINAKVLTVLACYMLSVSRYN